MINYVDEYINYLIKKKKLSNETISNYKLDLDKFINFITLCGYTIDNVTSDVINDFTDYQISLGISIRSCNRYVSCVRDFYKFLVLNNYVKDFDFLKAKTFHIDINDKNIVPSELLDEVVRRNGFVDSMNNYRNQAILYLFYITGIRTNELINLNVDDIDLSNNTVTIKDNKNVRVVPFNDTCNHILKDYFKYYRDGVMHLKPKEKALFVNKSKVRITRSLFNPMFKKIKNDTKCPIDLNSRMFRQSYIHRLLTNGMDVRLVSVLSGQLPNQNVYSTIKSVNNYISNKNVEQFCEEPYNPPHHKNK